ncbi:MAG: VPLPA-CTERM sorting domain-containing protein [Gammaproteobacteria bacterium]|nr:VPLPA-CTERM sorting domain-containing protein [Gammaproteobacteria bacterium]
MKKQLAVLLMLVSSSASAITTNYFGNFSNDDNVLLTTFDVDVTSIVHFESFAYAGGTMSDGTVVADGGFDSQLHLFDLNMNLIRSDDDGASRVSASSGNSWDSMFDYTLDAGSYIIALTQYNNDWMGGSWSGAGVTGFMDVSGSQRNSSYAFEISGTALVNVDGNVIEPPISAVPVPAAVWLFGSGLIGLAGVARRKK